MSTQTEHLGLHQWEPSDPFLRTDFNEDFAKIDAGVAEARSMCATGTYNALRTSPVVVTTGFRPSLVLLFYPYRNALGIHTEGGAFMVYRSGSSVAAGGLSGVTITDDGFELSTSCFLNGETDQRGTYAAFR